jgi:hypothetical protein
MVFHWHERKYLIRSNMKHGVLKCNKSASENSICYLRKLYKGTKFCVCRDNKATSLVAQKKTARQRSSLTPYLFNYTVGTGGSFPGGKARPGRDADHSPPSSAEVKKE